MERGLFGGAGMHGAGDIPCAIGQCGGEIRCRGEVKRGQPFAAGVGVFKVYERAKHSIFHMIADPVL